MILTADYHTHTIYSHGKGTPQQNVIEAIAKGLKRIAISEHGPASVYGVRGERLYRLRREVDELNRRFARDIEVLMGLECNLTGFGSCDLPSDTAMFDMLLLGYHRGILPKNAFATQALLTAFKLKKADMARNTDAVLETLQQYPIDILAHPGEYIPVDIKRLARGCAKLGVVLEINAKHTVFDAHTLNQAAEEGAVFAISSDAHDPKDVGVADIPILLAEQARITDRVINFEGFSAASNLRLLKKF